MSPTTKHTTELPSSHQNIFSILQVRRNKTSVPSDNVSGQLGSCQNDKVFKLLSLLKERQKVER